MNKSFHQTVGSWVQSMYLIHCWMEFLLRSFGKISSIGKVPRDREGTMILVDWGICRIHKVPVWRRANIGTGVSGPRVSPSDVFSPLAQI